MYRGSLRFAELNLQRQIPSPIFPREISPAFSTRVGPNESGVPSACRPEKKPLLSRPRIARLSLRPRWRAVLRSLENFPPRVSSASGCRARSAGEAIRRNLTSKNPEHLGTFFAVSGYKGFLPFEHIAPITRRCEFIISFWKKSWKSPLPRVTRKKRNVDEIRDLLIQFYWPGGSYPFKSDNSGYQKKKIQRELDWHVQYVIEREVYAYATFT